MSTSHRWTQMTTLSRSCDRVDWNIATPLPVNTFQGLGLATEWIEMDTPLTRVEHVIVSVLRPSGLKYQPRRLRNGDKSSRSCDRVDWNRRGDYEHSKGSGLGLATEWIEIRNILNFIRTLSGSRSCDRVDWNTFSLFFFTENGGLGLATEWIEISSWFYRLNTV